MMVSVFITKQCFSFFKLAIAGEPEEPNLLLK